MQRLPSSAPPSPEQVTLWRRLFRSQTAGVVSAVTRMADARAGGWPSTEFDTVRDGPLSAWADTEWADTQPSDLGDL